MPTALELQPRTYAHPCIEMLCESPAHILGNPPTIQVPAHIYDAQGNIRAEYRSKTLENGIHINQDGVVHCSFDCWREACE